MKIDIKTKLTSKGKIVKIMGCSNLNSSMLIQGFVFDSKICLFLKNVAVLLMRGLLIDALFSRLLTLLIRVSADMQLFRKSQVSWKSKSATWIFF